MKEKINKRNLFYTIDRAMIVGWTVQAFFYYPFRQNPTKKLSNLHFIAACQNYLPKLFKQYCGTSSVKTKIHFWKNVNGDRPLFVKQSN